MFPLYGGRGVVEKIILYFEICPNVVFDISIQQLIAISNESEIDIHEFPGGGGVGGGAGGGAGVGGGGGLQIKRAS